MAETRELRCRSRTYVVKRYDDATVALLDSRGQLVAGWPETVSLTGKPLGSLSEAEWCRVIHELRPSLVGH